MSSHLSIDFTNADVQIDESINLLSSINQLIKENPEKYAISDRA